MSSAVVCLYDVNSLIHCIERAFQPQSRVVGKGLGEEPLRKYHDEPFSSMIMS